MESTGNTMPRPNEDTRNLARSLDQASAGAHKVIDKASDAARPVVDRLASGAHQAVDKIATAAGQAADTLGVNAEQLKNAQVKVMEQCRGYVRDHPMASLGIAIGAGFILSRLMSSR